MRAGLRAACTLAFASLLVPARAASQPGALQPEVRTDVIIARATSAHLGVGLNASLGSYLRAGVTVAGGATRTNGGDVYGSGRADLVGRFLLDPFREHRWGPYAGGGIGVLHDGRSRWREAVLIVIGVEGSAAHRVRTALEVGFGGGTRAGLVLRWGRTGSR